MFTRKLTHGVVEIRRRDIQRYSNILLELFAENYLIVVRSDTAWNINELKELAQVYGHTYSSREYQKIVGEDTQSISHLHVDPDLEVVRVSNQLDEIGRPLGALGDASIGWHSDFSHIPGEYHGTILYNFIGGELAATHFCDTSVLFNKFRIPIETVGAETRLTHNLGYSVKDYSQAQLRLMRQKNTFLGRLSTSVERRIVPDVSPRGLRSLYISPETIDKTNVSPVLNPVFDYLDSEENEFYEHCWLSHDVLIFDNLTSLHRRSSFAGHRQLWRIHFSYENFYGHKMAPHNNY